MNCSSMKCFIRHFAVTKDDIILSIKDYIKHCETTEDEGWSENKREVILKLLYRFLGSVEQMLFPEIQLSNWYYEYRWTNDGIILELVHCDSAEFDKDGEIISMESSGQIKMTEVTCNYLSVEEYAKKYGVTVTAVRQWIRRGKLRTAKKIGRDWIIPELADKPGRGYEPVTYTWKRLSNEILKEYPYLGSCSAVYLMQDDGDKTFYSAMLLNKYGKPCEKIRMNIREREKLELALISEQDVENEEWYQNIIYVPAKQNTYYLKGGRMMYEKEWKKYQEGKRILKENQLEISTSNYFYDEDGMYIWQFSTELIQNRYEEQENGEDFEERTAVVKVKGGIVIPPETDFDADDKFCEYISAGELCDAMSAEMIAVYSEFANQNEGIKPEIIRELGLQEEVSFESSILYIEDVEMTELQYLEMFLKVFDFVVEGLPARDSRLALVLMNWEQENSKAKIFLECGWKIKNLDASAVIAYRKL